MVHVRRLHALLFAVSLALGAAEAGQAETGPAATCEHAQAIVGAADYLLEQPEDAPRFWRDRFGSDAAYLKIHYGGLSYHETRSLIASLGQRERPPERLDELRLAHATTADRAAEIAEMQASEANPVLPRLGASGWRALVERDGGEWLVGEAVRWREANSHAGLVDATLAQLPSALAGVREDRITDLAARFARASFGYAAVDLLSMKANLSDAVAMLDRFPDAAERAYGVKRIVQIVAQRPDFEVSRQPSDIRAAVASMHWWHSFRPITRLVAQMPEAAILSTLYYHTGDLRIGTEVAEGLLRDFEQGRLDPHLAPDEAVATMIAGLDRIFGKDRREKQLGSFAFAQYAQGGSDQTAQDFANTAIARTVLAAYLNGNDGEPPTRPAGLDTAFDWETFLGVATELRASRLVSAQNQAIASLLLASADRPVDALEALQLASERESARSAAHELMLRLDRRCQRLYGHPLPFMQALYRFE